MIVRTVVAFGFVTLAAIVPAWAQTPAPSAPRPSSPPAAAASPAASPAGSPAPAPATSPAPAASADPNVVKARVEFEAWQNGKIDLSHYIPEAVTQFTDAVVKSISDQSLKPLGAVKSVALLRTATVPGAVIYVYHVVCANGAVDESLSWNAAGKIQFIQFDPPKT